MSDRMMEVANKLDSTIDGIDRIVSDERNIESIGDTLENLSLLTGSLDDIIYSVSEGNGTIGKLIYDNGLYENIEGMTADLKANPWKLLYRPKVRKHDDK